MHVLPEILHRIWRAILDEARRRKFEFEATNPLRGFDASLGQTRVVRLGLVSCNGILYACRCGVNSRTAI